MNKDAVDALLRYHQQLCYADIHPEILAHIKNAIDTGEHIGQRVCIQGVWVRVEQEVDGGYGVYVDVVVPAKLEHVNITCAFSAAPSEGSDG